MAPMFGVPRAVMSRFSSPDPPVGLGHALQLDPLCLGVGVGEFVVFPQPVQDLLFLHGGGGPLLVQFGHRPLQVQQVLVHLLARPVLGSPLRLQGVLLLCDGGQPLPEGRAPARQLLQRRLQSGDLFLRGGDVSAVGLRHLFLLLPVTREIRAQRPQVRGAADCGLPFGRQGSQIALSAADLLGQGTDFSSSSDWPERAASAWARASAAADSCRLISTWAAADRASLSVSRPARLSSSPTRFSTLSSRERSRRSYCPLMPSSRRTSSSAWRR